MKRYRMANLLKFLVQTLFLFSPHWAYSEIIYEGWHKVLSAGQHAGYFVMRYDRDNKTNSFVYTSFLKTNALGNDVTEALKAEGIQVLTPKRWIVPKNYQYTSTQGKEITLIDAKFKIEDMTSNKGKKKKKDETSKSEPQLKLVMKAEITKGGKVESLTKELPENAFLSSFLSHIILQSKEGLKVGNPYKYVAIAEEDAKIYEGSVFVKETVKENGKDAFKLINEFKGVRFISVVTPKGEPLSTKSPLLSIATEASNNMADAIGNHKFDEKNIKTLFGNIPSSGVSK